MAGHSKWANIKHRKGAQDAKRGKLFTKLIREITVAAKTGDADPVNNPRLRAAVDSALSGNMTKDTIERAIKRGAGEEDGSNLDEVRYEGYGTGGTAILVDCMTDNRNRTVAEVRHAFTKFGGNLGTDGSVAYLFSKQGILLYAEGSDEDALTEAAIEAGAEDVIAEDDGSLTVITDPVEFHEVKKQLEEAGQAPDHAEISMQASTEAELNEDESRSLLKLLDMLEELDDVQEVFHNAKLDDSVLDELAAD